MDNIKSTILLELLAIMLISFRLKLQFLSCLLKAFNLIRRRPLIVNIQVIKVIYRIALYHTEKRLNRTKRIYILPLDVSKERQELLYFSHCNSRYLDRCHNFTGMFHKIYKVLQLEWGIYSRALISFFLGLGDDV